MKKLNRKDLNTRNVVQKLEEKKIALKALFYNAAVPVNLKFIIQQKMAQMPKSSSKTRVVNRCAITGRGRGILSLYNLSRIQVKDLASNGLLPGLKKISW